MDSFDICTTPTDFYRLASGLRGFFLIIGTHLLAGEVDTTLSDAPLWERLSWLLRYFNPVNLSWRYYSILSYRMAVWQFRGGGRRARAGAGAGTEPDVAGVGEAGTRGSSDGNQAGCGGGDGGKGLGGLCWIPCGWTRAEVGDRAEADVERMAEADGSGSGSDKTGGCGSGHNRRSHGPGSLPDIPRRAAWGDVQMAIINHEAHPFKHPLPYAVAENHGALHVRRLEPAGLFSSQGILTVSAGYQGVLALQYTVSTAGVAFLPNMTMPLAIMGLFRTAVSPWITSKVYVDPHCYPGQDVPASDYNPNRVLALGWLCTISGLVFLSFWPYLAYPAFDLPQDLMKLWIQIFYQYATVSMFFFHAVLLRHGSLAWANRILFFDHWVYKLQTVGFMGILVCMLALGISDYVRQDYYRHCG